MAASIFACSYAQNVSHASMELRFSHDFIPYPDALAFMESRVNDILHHSADTCCWLLQHPPLYTKGSSAKDSDLFISPFPVFSTGRGGQFTYHGPGQIVGYLMIDLRKLFQGNPDIRAYVRMLETWLIRTLSHYGITGFQREGRVGIWVHDASGNEQKIAAIGIRVRSWVAFHGVSLNVSPNLSHYAGIVPCGIREYGVTSMHALGVQVALSDVMLTMGNLAQEIFNNQETSRYSQ
jgi:lipoyl(octanoyl) transferase